MRSTPRPIKVQKAGIDRLKSVNIAIISIGIGIMPRKKNNIHDSKSADTCPCGCCKWHSSKSVQAVLAVMFILIVAAFVASLAFARASAYFSNTVLSFMGVIFLIVFIGWIFGFFCSCRGVHWSRHGFGRFDEATMVLRKKYANGEISKKEYDRVIKDLE